LLENEGIALVFLPFEILRCRFATKIAIDTLTIDVELAVYAFGILVLAVCHWISRGTGHCFAHPEARCNPFFPVRLKGVIRR
jgi:hypothetical protein